MFENLPVPLRYRKQFNFFFFRSRQINKIRMQSFKIGIRVGYGAFLCTGIFSYLPEGLSTSVSEFIKISVADPDPGFGALRPLDPGWVKNQDPDSDHISQDSCGSGPGSGIFFILDLGWKSRIRDKHPGSATLIKMF
jgi:hypothetical protein